MKCFLATYVIQFAEAVTRDNQYIKGLDHSIVIMLVYRLFILSYDFAKQKNDNTVYGQYIVAVKSYFLFNTTCIFRNIMNIEF